MWDASMGSDHSDGDDGEKCDGEVARTEPKVSLRERPGASIEDRATDVTDDCVREEDRLGRGGAMSPLRACAGDERSGELGRFNFHTGGDRCREDSSSGEVLRSDRAIA